RRSRNNSEDREHLTQLLSRRGLRRGRLGAVHRGAWRRRGRKRHVYLAITIIDQGSEADGKQDGRGKCVQGGTPAEDDDATDEVDDENDEHRLKPGIFSGHKHNRASTQPNAEAPLKFRACDCVISSRRSIESRQTWP